MNITQQREKSSKSLVNSMNKVTMNENVSKVRCTEHCLNKKDGNSFLIQLKSFEQQSYSTFFSIIQPRVLPCTERSAVIVSLDQYVCLQETIFFFGHHLWWTAAAAEIGELFMNDCSSQLGTNSCPYDFFYNNEDQVWLVTCGQAVVSFNNPALLCFTSNNWILRFLSQSMPL